MHRTLNTCALLVMSAMLVLIAVGGGKIAQQVKTASTSTPVELSPEGEIAQFAAATRDELETYAARDGYCGSRGCDIAAWVEDNRQ